MYSRSFFDLDGHGWQVTWIEPAALEKDAETIAASMHHADARGLTHYEGLEQMKTVVGRTVGLLHAAIRQ